MTRAIDGLSTGGRRLPDGPAWAGAVEGRSARPAADAAGRVAFLRQVIHGLGQSAKQLPCKYFYDRRGSQLFDQICELPEYYVTRTEVAILRRYGPEMAAALGERCRLVEYGSGSSLKTRLLLDALRAPAAYVPLDISGEHLMEAAGRLRAAYPALNVLPVCADYTQDFDIPECGGAARTAIYFPGSTIGNFDPPAARVFLRKAADRCRKGDALLIGVDLKKDPAVLHAAYNDAAGVTAAFNLNLLGRINRELGGNFALGRFDHYAFYNPLPGRIEMHLVSRRRQVVRIAGQTFSFADGETIFTESSYKYTQESFAALAAGAGWMPGRAWTDDRRWFGVQYLTRA